VVTSSVVLSTKLRDSVGGRTASGLQKAFGLETVHDLLLYLPRRYSRRGELTDFGSLREGELVTVMARVKSVSTRQMRQRRGTITEVIVTDGQNELSLTFFRKPWGTKLTPGSVGLFAGKISRYNGKLQLTHPECNMFDTSDSDGSLDEDALETFANEILPVYPASASFASWKISQAVRMVLDQIDWDKETDPLPIDVAKRHDLVSLSQAYESVHRPTDDQQIGHALERIRWDEALALQTVLAVRRERLTSQPALPRNRRATGLLADFEVSLPFELTEGQRDIGNQIFADMSSDHPMHRLLQGEVGSGKTVIALRAMLAVVDAGGQAALLAPTEVLAAQHARSIRTLLGPLAEGGQLEGAQNATRVALITGSLSAANKRAALLEAASGQAGIVIGTHALLEEKVTFADLGLVVVDEQHRFGVEQRAALAEKSASGQRPHVLVMTATPIPRTVAITVFGDLDVSVLSELPRGRAPITTFVVPTREKPTFLERTWERIREEVSAGHQAYIVCPRIVATESDDDGAGAEVVAGDLDSDGLDFDVLDAEADVAAPMASVDQVAAELTAGALKGLRVEVLHGRMPGDEKDAIMRRFSQDPETDDGIDVLVSTTVIEVGVDVANATVMVVMDADRFGISQLHQLRGRIGRGGHPGLCLLVTSAPPGSPARERLELVAGTVDGFELARIDLSSRREGDVLGADQSGRKSSLRSLSLLRDEDIIVSARAEAELIVANDPDLSEHVALAELASDLVGPQAADWLDRS
jgi:ATP-dependent DNA helicase RecG